MSWEEPHPRRLPSSAEYQENERIIQELESKIAELKQGLRDLEWERDKRRSFIAPFRRLPAEILCEIGSHYVQMRGSPQILNQVCRSLREAVNGHKGLWNRIFLSSVLEDDTLFHQDRFQGYFACESESIRYLQLLLDRAIPLPLNIALEDWNKGFWQSQGDFRALVESLAPYSHLIHTLSLIGLSIEPEYPPLDLSRLRDLFLEGDTDLQSTMTWVLNSLGGSFSSLSQLTIRTRLGFIESTLRGVSVPDTLKINLELWVDRDQPDVDLEYNLDEVHLPDISHLTITALPVLLRYIQVKKVITLRIIGEDPEAEDAEKENDWEKYVRNRIMQVVHIPSIDTLESLEIMRVPIEPNIYPPYLDPQEFLKLRTLKLDQKVWRADRANPHLLLIPTLEDLTLIDCDWETYSGGTCPYLFGPLGLKHLVLAQTTGTLDITSHSKTQPNLLTLKMIDCRLSREFLRSLSNIDGQSFHTLPLLELIEICNCSTADRDYGRSQFIRDCSIGRPNTRVIITP